MRILTAITAIVILGVPVGAIKLYQVEFSPPAPAEVTVKPTPQPATPRPAIPRQKNSPVPPVPQPLPPIGAWVVGLGTPAGLVFLLTTIK